MIEPSLSGSVATCSRVFAIALSSLSKTLQECFKRTSRFVGCTLTSTSPAGISKESTAIGWRPCISLVLYPRRIDWWNGPEATGRSLIRM